MTAPSPYRQHCLNRASGLLAVLLGIIAQSATAEAAPPAAPLAISAANRPWDDGTSIDVTISLPAEQQPGALYVVKRSQQFPGVYEEVDRFEASPQAVRQGTLKVRITKCVRDAEYWFLAAAVNSDGETSAYVETPASAGVRPVRELFDGSRAWLAGIAAVICSSVVLFVVLAAKGMPLKVRQIAGLQAIEEAVGRATEMGRSCVYVPGIMDMNDMQTIAGLTILSRVAERAAEYDCTLEVPTSRSLVMTAAREAVQSAYLTAGRPDAYNPDLISYITDEQFAFVSYLTGKMVREKPAACFYLGSFFAESLILSETGNSVGAIQIAGTAEPAQLPFFVAACDYTLIGEEFFAASAYLSGKPDQLGSLKGQDVGKLVAAVLILIGVTLSTVAEMRPDSSAAAYSQYLRDRILHSSD